MMTGYFGVPGGYGGKVHLVENGLPVCKARLSPLAEFQWCAPGIQMSYLECLNCRRTAEHIKLLEEVERIKRMTPAEKRRHKIRLNFQIKYVTDLSASQKNWVETALEALKL